MEFEREISSLPLSQTQIQMFNDKGFHIVNEIKDFDENFNVDELMKSPETKTALQLLEEEKNIKEIYSYLPNFDRFLEGILRPGLITEFVGLPGSGRTQMCLHLSVSAQMVDDFLSGCTVYISTNLDFSISRLKEIVNNYRKKVECFRNLKEVDILKNIQFISIMTVKELSACLEYLKEFAEMKRNIRLVIIDSITNPFRSCDRDEKTSMMHLIIIQLRHLAKNFDLNVVLTNNMTTVIGSNGNEVVPSLRDTFYHLINNRILLSQNDDTFNAEILKCSSKFPMKCHFKFLDDETKHFPSI